VDGRLQQLVLGTEKIATKQFANSRPALVLAFEVRPYFVAYLQKMSPQSHLHKSSRSVIDPLMQKNQVYTNVFTFSLRLHLMR
jgi:hypothetical protein